MVSSTRMAFSERVAHGLADLGGAELAAGARRALRRLQHGLGLRGDQGLGPFVQAGGAVLRRRGQHVHGAALGHQIACLARIGEEGHRRLRVHQDQVPHIGQLHPGQFGQVGDTLHRWQARAARHAGGEDLGQQAHAGLHRGDSRRSQQRRFAQRASAQQQRTDAT